MRFQCEEQGPRACPECRRTVYPHHGLRSNVTRRISATEAVIDMCCLWVWTCCGTEPFAAGEFEPCEPVRRMLYEARRRLNFEMRNLEAYMASEAKTPGLN